jgi:hypothetical protein
MLRFNDKTAARARNALEKCADLGDLFLAKASCGRFLRVQFVLHDARGNARQECWAYPAGTPEHRVRKIRDAVVADVLAGRVASGAVLEAMRLAIRKHVAELNSEDARRVLGKV